MDAVSRATNVHTQTVINFLAGRTWGDLPIIWRLEAGLGVRLWSDEHLGEQKERSLRGDGQ